MYKNKLGGDLYAVSQVGVSILPTKPIKPPELQNFGRFDSVFSKFGAIAVSIFM